MAEFAEIDVTGWLPAAIEQLGTKPKQWRESPDREMWLFKDVTRNRRADGSSYAKGDDWSERIAGALAGELGLPAAQVELAVRHDAGTVTYGVISKKVLTADESLIHGNELLAEIELSGMSAKDRTGYTLDAVKTVLDLVDPPVSGEDLTAWDFWAGYIVLDALVGNTDRHQENWAVIGDGNRRLAPTFDHASSLGFLLDDADRLSRLSTTDQNRTVAGYARRARSKFEGEPHPCTAAADALGMCSDLARRRWIEQIGDRPSIEDLLDRIPRHRASVPARAFAAELYAMNRVRLLSYPVCSLAS